MLKACAPRILIVIALLSVCRLSTADQPQTTRLPPLKEVQVVSTLDQVLQPVRVWSPHELKQPTPMLVFLHSWSGDWRQDNAKWQREAVARGWIFLHPNFRGRNDHPEACGSPLARRDILDAIAWAEKNYPVDKERIYLAGTSGGGHMAMLMAARHPERFSAVSAWVGISDLPAWYTFHTPDGQPQNYARMILACLGGPPGKNPAIDADYRDRSPLHHIHNAVGLPLDLNAGVNDGHTGSVPIDQTLNAFNVVAAAFQKSLPADVQSPANLLISENEIRELLKQRRLTQPRVSDTATDNSYNRELRLRRQAGACRVTIFDGGHEGLPTPACAWLARQKQQTTTPQFPQESLIPVQNDKKQSR